MGFMGSLRVSLGGDAALLRRFLVRAAVYGVVQGVALAALIPLASALVNSDPDRAWRWFLVLAVSAGVALIPHYLQAMAAFEVALSALQRMQHRLGDHVVRLPLGWFTGNRASAVSLAATKGVVSVGNNAAHSFGHVVVGWASATTITVFCLWWNPVTGMVLAAGIPVIAVARVLSLRISDRADARTAEHSAELNRHLLEYTRNQTVLRAAGRTQDYRPLDDAITQHSGSQQRLLWMQVASQMITGVFLQAVIAAVFATGMWMVLDRGADAGAVVGLLAAALRYYQGLARAVEEAMALRVAHLELRRIHHILTSEALPEPASTAPLPEPGTVRLDDVHFTYAEEPVLRGVSLRAEPGSVTAIVGPSGSGKSTMLALIARFHDADSGTVEVGGLAVTEQTTTDLMRALSPVFQDVYLFDDTLRANVLIGRPDAGDADLRDVATAAGVDEIVDRLPQGWQTPVGEAGTSLSGGERQRVALARALLKQAPVLLLDEATAALDPENERHVTASLNAIRGHSTILVIAHRLHTIVDADNVVLLSASGDVVDQGPHHELIERCIEYQNFWRSRERAENWQWRSPSAAT